MGHPSPPFITPILFHTKLCSRETNFSAGEQSFSTRERIQSAVHVACAWPLCDRLHRPWPAGAWAAQCPAFGSSARALLGHGKRGFFLAITVRRARAAEDWRKAGSHIGGQRFAIIDDYTCPKVWASPTQAEFCPLKNS